jgi:hypothetical protein
MRTALATIVLAGAAPLALAQSDINPLRKHSWGENIGWMNWRDAGSPPSGQGVLIPADYLAGHIWAENVGWISLGDGTPADGLAYANTTGADHGVNIDPATGDLFGLAWGENIGWINFDTRAALALSGRQARFDGQAGRFRGYAWGENIGWVNLDDETHFVQVGCSADYHPDGVLNFFDVSAFLALYNAQDAAADLFPDAQFNFFDISAFLNDFNAGCP